jgi:protein-S-isoprenylcysteine O-methyltransferase Ste14
MESKINLNEIEKKTYLAYHGDGIWDIFFGLFFISIGFFMIFDTVYLMGIIPATMLPAVLGAKKSFTLPRMGYVKFSPERQARIRRGIRILLILFTFTMLAGVGAFMAFTGDSEWQKAIRSLGLIPFGTVLALISGVIGILFGFRRFTVYAGVILVLFIAGHFANSDPPAYFILIGLIVLVVGIVMLIRFVRKYPKSKEEFHHVS